MRAYNNQRDYDSMEAEEVLDEMKISHLRAELEGLEAEIEDMEISIKIRKDMAKEIREDLEGYDPL